MTISPHQPPAGHHLRGRLGYGDLRHAYDREAIVKTTALAWFFVSSILGALAVVAVMHWKRK